MSQTLASVSDAQLVLPLQAAWFGAVFDRQINPLPLLNTV